MSKDDSNVTVEGEINAGWTSYFDPDKHGQTVSGTSDDDLGEIKTKWLPEGIDVSDLSGKRRKILEIYHQHDDITDERIADLADCTEVHVTTTLDEYLERDHIAAAENDIGSILREDIDSSDVTKRDAEILDGYYQSVGAPLEEIAEEVGTNKAHVSRVVRKLVREDSEESNNAYEKSDREVPDSHINAYLVEGASCDDLTSLQRSIVEEWVKSDGEISHSELARELDCHRTSIGKTLNKYVEYYSEGGETRLGEAAPNDISPESVGEGSETSRQSHLPDPEQGPEQLSKEGVQEVRHTVVHEHHHTVEHKSDNLSETVGVVAGVTLAASVVESVFEVLEK